MCFSIHEDHKTPKIAKKDIICFKAFLKGRKSKYFTSSYRSFKFEKGECYYENKLDMKAKEAILIGLHSYSSLDIIRTHVSRWRDDIGVMCIIPEGATYYYNPLDKEYVSDYLIIGTDKDII